ncbi:ABC transporter F family member 2 [Gracilariopsis chorda]|uniref:Probable ATP-dependent transporter ycf16 n=1 Tax=Gracilariopsis chorda TaxID=448386 RepID=A0A2V3IUK5_9FLOR|nr:ABC transporter F family member 2 [Gracilariopsis chorda]|eukprot:PXF45816.1 ABC transporter F family member 2 [Gracilariopsis chorda]
MPPKNKSKKFLAKQRAREEAEAAKKGPEAVEAVRRKYETSSTSKTKSKRIEDASSSVTADSVKDELGDAAADTSTTATGILMSVYGARDIKIGAFSLNFHNKVLVEDTLIELTVGKRYGLIGRNGCGKSTFLKVLAERQVPIPEYIDIHLLSEEAHPSDDTALDYVINSARAEVTRLEARADDILTEEGPESLLLNDIYEKLDELDPSTFESRASTILCGLGFNAQTMQKKTKDMSGGWRMRVALAKALFIQPTMLLLDEPTNHLDLSACVWLEEYLSRYSKILIVVSHSQDFLDGVCTDTMVMQQQKLKYWGGNYSTYVRTREEQDTNKLKLYKKQQEEIKHIKQFIASCGTYANLVRQAKSRQKQLDKMVEAGLLEPPYAEPRFKFSFLGCGTLAPPLISFSDVAFSYSGKKEDYLYSNLSFGIDGESRVSLVGPNGAGKSTLLNLMLQELGPCEGTVSHKSGLRVGRYHQHSADQLDFNLSPVEYVRSKYPKLHETLQGYRAEVGRFGITGEAQLAPIAHLSEGMKSRLVFAEIAIRKPHILLLDEPTNALDVNGIDALAEAINNFEGGVVLVSHDFRLLSQVAREIWVVENGVKVWDGDILSYKESLKKGMKF